MAHQGLDTLLYWHTDPDSVILETIKAKVLEIRCGFAQCSDEWIAKHLPNYYPDDQSYVEELDQAAFIERFVKAAEEKAGMRW